MAATFQVVAREVEFPSRHITYDVIRNDGRVVRSGMWPDYAEADCALLNLCVAEGWPAAKYHQARADVMRKVAVFRHAGFVPAIS